MLVIALVGFLNFRGRHAIERFKTVGTVLLYAGYLIFSGVVLTSTWGQVEGAFAMRDHSFVEGATLGSAVFSGVLYVGVLLGSDAELSLRARSPDRATPSARSGLVSGILATVPFALTYFAVMASIQKRVCWRPPCPGSRC